MYDASLLKAAFRQRGLNYRRLAQLAGVNKVTAQRVVDTGTGHPRSVFKVAKALGFPVKPLDEYAFDMTSIMKKRRSA